MRPRRGRCSSLAGLRARRPWRSCPQRTYLLSPVLDEKDEKKAATAEWAASASNETPQWVRISPPSPHPCPFARDLLVSGLLRPMEDVFRVDGFPLQAIQIAYFIHLEPARKPLSRLRQTKDAEASEASLSSWSYKLLRPAVRTDGSARNFLKPAPSLPRLTHSLSTAGDRSTEDSGAP